MPFKLQILYYLIRLKLNKLFRLSISFQQKRKWKRLQRHLKQSEFYANFANKDLSDYPIFDKQKFMELFNQINTVNIQKANALEVAQKSEESRDFSSELNGVTIGLSSGTSGNRGLFLASQSERAKWVAAVLDRVLGFKMKKRKIAFFLRANSNLYESVKSNLLEFKFFDLMDPFDQLIANLLKEKPNIIVAPPSVLIEIMENVQYQDLDFSPEKIIAVAEVLYPEDQARLETYWNQTIHQVYQCTEGFLASTCSKGKLHLNEDWLIIEKNYLDAEKKKYHPIITDLERFSQPVIRYELNDILHEGNCSCGNPSSVIEMIEGRADDILRFVDSSGQEKMIFPDFLRRNIISSDERITDYLITQESSDRVGLYVNGDSELYTKAKASITEFLKKKEIENVSIHELEKKPLERHMKLRRIINNYGKIH